MKAIINQTVVPLFSVPSHQSTVEDEVLFGMVVEILDHPTAGWYKIRTHYRYEGLVAEDTLLIGDEQTAAWEALPKKVVLHKNCVDVLSAPKVQGWHMQQLTRGCLVSPVGEAENGW